MSYSYFHIQDCIYCHLIILGKHLEYPSSYCIFGYHCIFTQGVDLFGEVSLVVIGRDQAVHRDQVVTQANWTRATFKGPRGRSGGLQTGVLDEVYIGCKLHFNQWISRFECGALYSSWFFPMVGFPRIHQVLFKFLTILHLLYLY